MTAMNHIRYLAEIIGPRGSTSARCLVKEVCDR